MKKRNTGKKCRVHAPHPPVSGRLAGKETRRAALSDAFSGKRKHRAALTDAFAGKEKRRAALTAAFAPPPPLEADAFLTERGFPVPAHFPGGSEPYIVKPDRDGGGRGIWVTEDFCEVGGAVNAGFVAQEELEGPVWSAAVTGAPGAYTVHAPPGSRSPAGPARARSVSLPRRSKNSRPWPPALRRPWVCGASWRWRPSGAGTAGG